MNWLYSPLPPTGIKIRIIRSDDDSDDDSCDEHDHESDENDEEDNHHRSKTKPILEEPPQKPFCSFRESQASCSGNVDRSSYPSPKESEFTLEKPIISSQARTKKSSLEFEFNSLIKSKNPTTIPCMPQQVHLAQEPSTMTATKGNSWSRHDGSQSDDNLSASSATEPESRSNERPASFNLSRENVSKNCDYGSELSTTESDSQSNKQPASSVVTQGNPSKNLNRSCELQSTDSGSLSDSRPTSSDSEPSRKPAAFRVTGKNIPDRNSACAESSTNNRKLELNKRLVSPQFHGLRGELPASGYAGNPTEHQSDETLSKSSGPAKSNAQVDCESLKIGSKPLASADVSDNDFSGVGLRKTYKDQQPDHCRSRQVTYPRIQFESKPNFEIHDGTQDAIGPLELDQSVQLTASINKFLKPYQRDGVKFFFKHYQLKNGVILGDDMGLGKTIQVIAFLSAVMGKTGTPSDKGRRRAAINKLLPGRTYKPSELGPTCLVICPNSVIDNWTNELKTWGYFEYATLGANTSSADTISRFNVGAFDILVTGFNYARDHIEDLYDLDFTIVVVDEVQKLKKHTAAITKAFHRFKTKIRFGLTGTAMQNDLSELHSLFDWVRPGALGTMRMWKAFVCDPILQSRKSDASTYEIYLGSVRAEALVKKCWPGLQLRRTKAQILHELPRRTDKIALCPMTSTQKTAYKNLSSDPDVANMRNHNEPCHCGKTNKSGQRFPLGLCCDQGWVRRILPYVTVFKKISNHLALTYPNKQDKPEKYEQDKMFIKKMFPNDYLHREHHFSCDYDTELCGKWRVLKPLLDEWKKERLKVLIFSQSTKMMDIIEYWLQQSFPDFVRLDGNVPIKERFKRVTEFQTDSNKFIFLASTNAAGVGLNLTAANKVVIFDPSWNPSSDAQAVDRVVRIGQKRDVECIRLISLGSTEELIYHRQVYKQHLFEVANTGEAPNRYFTGVQGDKKNQGDTFGVKNIFKQKLGPMTDLDTPEAVEEFTYAINQMANSQLCANSVNKTDEYSLQVLTTLPENSQPNPHSTEAILRDCGVNEIWNHGEVLQPRISCKGTALCGSKPTNSMKKFKRSISASSVAPPLRGAQLKPKLPKQPIDSGKTNQKAHGGTNSPSNSNSDSVQEISAQDFTTLPLKRRKTTE